MLWSWSVQRSVCRLFFSLAGGTDAVELYMVVVCLEAAVSLGRRNRAALDVFDLSTARADEMVVVMVAESLFIQCLLAVEVHPADQASLLERF